MNTKKIEIIQTLKDNYNRDLRKQVVKTILAEEKDKDKPVYKIINQIFTYVIKELDWRIEDNVKDWDNTPLEIMEEAFPKLASTNWFEEQLLTAEKMREMEMKG